MQMAYFIINVLYLPFASFLSIYRLICALINDKRCITLPTVNCRPFSKSFKTTISEAKGSTLTMQLQKDCGKHGTAHWVNTVHTV